MTTGYGRAGLQPLAARASGAIHASGTVSAAAATATGRVVVVGFAPEVNVAAPVQADSRSRYDIDTNSPASAPPESAERLLCYLLPMHRRNEILGDLAEDYRTNFLPKYGPREAQRMYWSHFIRSVAATVPPWLWAAILGGVGWLWSKFGS